MIGEARAHYRITAALGAGGMGEVYRAADTKLGRDVAIKVLPAEVAQDPARLERFQREARLLAALNHPHIAAIHGLEEADGPPFLVLELVEGEDLAQRLSRGAIPVDEALEIARQVAEALEAAHDNGIVHRDLKPANVRVTPGGEVKVLDFGLAKAWAGDAAEAGSDSASMSQSPTLAHSGTQAGVILGTAAYMSPEQARGKRVDRRTDVWAFGVLLWEMLTGHGLFSGETVTDVIAAVVTQEPDLDALPVETPRAVRWLLARCLRKDPRTRLPDIGAARLTLQDVLGGTAPEAEARDGEAGGTTGAQTRRGMMERWGWVAVALVTTAIAATLLVERSTRVPEPRPAVRLTVEVPEGFRGWPIPSPDGRHIAFRAGLEEPGEGDLSEVVWLHSLESGRSRPLRGTEAGRMTSQPFWSPDSRSIGFFTDRELRRLSLDDDTVRTICALPGQSGYDADWNESGTILFGSWDGRDRTERNGLYTVAATGGEPTPLLMVDPARDEVGLGAPQFLPDGRRFLFVGRGWAPDERPNVLPVHVGSLDHPEERRVLLPETFFRGLARDHVLFTREDTLLAQPFDSRRAELRGEAVAVASPVALTGTGVGRFGVSPGGTLAYLSGEEEDWSQLTWFDRSGEPIGTVGAPEEYGQIALSPDETRLAVEIRGDEGIQDDLWIIDVSRGVRTRLAGDLAAVTSPIWSPDGRELAFHKGARTGGGDVLRMGLHSGATATPLLEPGYNLPEDWSRDGETLLYVSRQTPRSIESSLWALPLSGPGPPELVAQGAGHRLNRARLSPDGRWLAYISNESGAWEVYVEPFRREGERVLVSVGGGGQPAWRGDGKELFYRKPDGPLMAVDVREAARGLEVGAPTPLFDAGLAGGPAGSYYAVTADGQRFLVRLPVENREKLQMHVVVNWESLLER